MTTKASFQNAPASPSQPCLNTGDARPPRISPRQKGQQADGLPSLNLFPRLIGLPSLTPHPHATSPSSRLGPPGRRADLHSHHPALHAGPTAAEDCGTPPGPPQRPTAPDLWVAPTLFLSIAICEGYMLSWPVSTPPPWYGPGGAGRLLDGGRPGKKLSSELNITLHKA